MAPGATVRDSILMNDAVVEEGAVVDNAILDKRVRVGAGTRLGGGRDNRANLLWPQRLGSGLTVVGKGSVIPPGIRVGRNVCIGAHVEPEAFTSPEVPSGESIL